MTNEEVKRYRFSFGSAVIREAGGEWVRYEDLLATRRALKMAQAKGLWRLGWTLYHAAYAAPPVCFRRGRKQRAMRLVTFWRKKFEREAKEMGNV